MILDTHYHLDFLGEQQDLFLDAIASHRVALVAQTLTPSSFRAYDAPRVLPSLGYHPWNIQPERVEEELAGFDSAVGSTHFIGEIGLDFTPRRLETADTALQVRVLRHIMESALRQGREYVLSIHAVRAATEVLDLVEALGLASKKITPIMHRFGGTSDELTRLIRLGGCISVGPQMLATKRGRAYATQVPTDRLLLETDLPGDGAVSVVEHASELVEALNSTLSTLTELRGTKVRDAIADNQRRLYGSFGGAAGN